MAPPSNAFVLYTHAHKKTIGGEASIVELPKKTTTEPSSKTRYFHPSYLKNKEKGVGAETSQKNELTPIVGSVFFPLIRFYDKPIRTLRMLKEDKFILSLLLRCLGVLLFLSVHANIFTRMATAFSSFAIALVDRPSIAQDADVQKALLTSMCLMIDVCPSHWINEISEILQPIIPYFQVQYSSVYVYMGGWGVF
eukprot:m.122211 g.122211  ORF g.122211 m.122211 type:complete len:195 (+) comp12935_c0_seq4:15-599(+)